MQEGSSSLAPDPALQRLSILTGAPAVERLARTKVIVFGLGGVGSWCAEALARSGIGTIALVDSDVVCVTNINRQVQATPLSVGKSKTAELGRRLREIRPEATIIEMQAVYHRTTADKFDLASYDYVLDCIDSIACKVELIMHAAKAGATVYVALGASSRLDPTKIAVGSLWDSYNCPLGRYVRKKLRQSGFRDEVTCVYSPEEGRHFPGEALCGTGACLCPKSAPGEATEEGRREWCSSKKQINGSAVHMTGTFGFMLAGLVIQDVVKRAEGQA
jgi:tRNA A37 threonylcarbamoyladenosine dehydratase